MLLFGWAGGGGRGSQQEVIGLIAETGCRQERHAEKDCRRERDTRSNLFSNSWEPLSVADVQPSVIQKEEKKRREEQNEGGRVGGGWSRKSRRCENGFISSSCVGHSGPTNPFSVSLLFHPLFFQPILLPFYFFFFASSSSFVMSKRREKERDFTNVEFPPPLPLPLFLMSSVQGEMNGVSTGHNKESLQLKKKKKEIFTRHSAFPQYSLKKRERERYSKTRIIGTGREIWGQFLF